MNRLLMVCWVVVLFGCGLVQAADVKKVEPPRLVVQKGHGDEVTNVAFSPDGKSLVSGSLDNTIKLWDVSSGRELRTFNGHIAGVRSVAFSPNGKTVVSGCDDGTLKLWDVTTGQELRNIAGNGKAVESVTFSPDGKTVISAGVDKLLKRWDTVTGYELPTFEEYKYAVHTDRKGVIARKIWEVNSVVFSPDGKTLVSSLSDNTLKLWNVVTGNELRTLVGHKLGVDSVAFSPDGKTVASGSNDKTLKLWEVETGRELRTFVGHEAQVATVSFSPNGKTLASVSIDRTLKLWDVATGQVLHTFTGDRDHLNWSVAFSPDSKMLSGSNGSTIKLWDVATGQVLRTLAGNAGIVTSATFSPDGKTVISGSEDKQFKFWDIAKGRAIPRFAGHSDSVMSVAFSPDGKTIVSGSLDKTVKIWNVDSGREMLTFVGHKRAVTSVNFSPDGKSVVSGSIDNTIKIWDMASGIEHRSIDAYDSRWVMSVSFSLDGKTIVSGGGQDKTFKLWDVTTGLGIRIFTGHDKPLHCVTFSPDGKTVASGSYDKTIKLWDIARGRELRTLSGHSNDVNSVAFSPDGNIVVSGSSDKTIKLWDVASGLELRTLSGHSNDVNSVAFSPDGKIVVSGSSDKTIKLWRVSDGTLLATLTSFIDGRWAVTDPEGRFDTADLEDMPHLHWVMPDDPMTPLPLEIFMRDYYEPRLLPRIMNGEKFKPVRALGELNRVQPEVKITGIEPDAETGYVKVNVEATGARRAYTSKGKPISTAAHDLRLFRNGQMVGYAEGKLAEAGGKPFQRTFRVRLPSGKAPLNFTAYAFNDDRVKSATAQQSYTPPSAIVVGKPRAYLITVGVNRHDNPAWNLRYAANDARQIGQSVAPLLKNQKRYEEVVTVPLISDTEGHDLATKANIKAVLDVLAGRKADVSALPGGDKLRQASPDDLVLISFSGHGFGEGGLFYLIPGDTGAGSGREITPELTAHAVSSDELSAWLRDVDAGDMAMIVDACHSAASVGDEFKPGPMGSRGLGQLAFDKGMRILAASQADDVALESDLIKQGLLSFALVENGLESQQADFKPKDKKITLEEWLSYGVSRVPSLAEEVKSGTVVASRGAVRTAAGELKKKRVIQQPALFDFTKGRRDAVLEAGLK